MNPHVPSTDLVAAPERVPGPARRGGATRSRLTWVLALSAVVSGLLWTGGARTNPAHAAGDSRALFPLVIAGDESAQRFRAAKKRIDRGIFDASELEDAGSAPSDGTGIHPEIVEGLRRLQTLHEEIWGRNHMLFDSGRTRLDAEVAISLTEEIIATLRGLPPTVRAFYVEEFGLSARTLLERALASRDVDSLLRTAKLYPLVETAPRALLAAGDLCFERAEISRAAGIWAVVPDFVAAGEFAEEIAVRRALIASRRGTRAEREAAARDLAAFGRTLPELTDRETPAIASGRAKVGDLPALPFRSGRLAWRTVDYIGGNRVQSGTELPFLADPTFGDGWLGVASSSYLSRFAIDTGKQVSEVNLLPDPYYRERTSLPRFYTAGEGDTLVTSFVSDSSDSKNYLGYDITVEIPQRGLKGVRISASGDDDVWDTTHDERDPLLGELSFNGSILVDSGRVYALGWRKKGYIDVFLVCLDLHSGKRLWSAPIVGNQVELTMFGEAAYEPVVGQVAIAEDAVYCSTNLGAIAKIRASDGHVLWATAYDPQFLRHRFGRRQAPSEQRTSWERNPIILHDGRLFATPLDSTELLVIDPDDGRVMQSVRGLGGRMVGIWEDFLVMHHQSTFRLLPYRDLDRRDGRSIRHSGSVRSAPALVTDGILYATTRDDIFFRSFRDDSEERICSYGPPGITAGSSSSDGRSVDGDVHVVGDRILTVSSRWIQCYAESFSPSGRRGR